MTDWQRLASLECVKGVIQKDGFVHIYFKRARTTQKELEMIDDLTTGEVGPIAARADGQLFVKVRADG